MRPERTETILNQFLISAVKDANSISPEFNLDKIVRQKSSSVTPILFIVSSGSDPS
jgi:hypothetical protein